MKGKEIIEKIVRDEMPDMEQLRQSCISKAEQATPVRERRVPVWAKTSAVAVLSIALVFAAGAGLFDFSNFGRQEGVDTGSYYGTTAQRQKRGFALAARAAADVPDSESAADNTSENIVKRGAEALTLNAESFVVETSFIGDEFVTRHGLLFDKVGDDVESVVVKRASNATAITGPRDQRDGLAAEDGADWERFVLWHAHVSDEEGSYFLDSRDVQLAVMLEGERSGVIELEVTFTDGETENYTVTITPNVERNYDNATLISFDISID